MSLPTQTVRFGPFQLDLRAAELHHNGSKVKLPEQPFQILCELVEHPGEVVTREELRQRLWRSDTFVDFEHGLNTAVKRLREALGDSAENPRYVETLPRHGYRLIVPVEKPEPVIPEASNRRRVIWLSVSAVLVVAVAAGLVWRLQLLQRFRPVKIESLAVLPLENLSGNPDEEYFADGMTEALITELGKVQAMRVISRQSVMHYKGTNKTVPQIAKELQVDAVVEGSALRSGDRVRITTQLVQANPERHLWSESYERDLRDVIALQREISQAIVGEIQVKVRPRQGARPAKALPVNPEAYDAYLRGRYNFERGPIKLDQAISYFQQAVRKDPRYASAYAWLAHCYVNSGLYHPPREFLPKAREAALKALEIDDTEAAAHAALGWVKATYDWDWYGAERELRRAIELDPSSSAVRWQYVWYLSVMARFDDAIAEARDAKKLDPLSVRTTRSLGWAYLHARRYDEAMDQFQQALELEPNYPIAQFYLADCYLLKGMYPEALALLQKLRPRPDASLASLAYLYGVTGRRSEALKVIADMKRQPYIDPLFLVIAYAGVGDRDNAIRLLNKGYAERSPQMPFLKVEPFLDPLRSDQRFQELVRRMKFPSGEPLR